MPVINPRDSGGSNQQRATFRPPWVKDGPSPLPMPAAPWNPRSREANTTTADEKPKVSKFFARGKKLVKLIFSINNFRITF